MKKKILWGVLLLAVLLIVCLVVDRNRDRTVGQLYPELESATACKIVTVTADTNREKALEDKELETFLEHLSQTHCCYEGWASGDTYEGQLYRLYLFSSEQELESIFVTSTGYLKIGSRGYSLLNDEFLQYLNHVLTS